MRPEIGLQPFKVILQNPLRFYKNQISLTGTPVHTCTPGVVYLFFKGDLTKKPCFICTLLLDTLFI